MKISLKPRRAIGKPLTEMERAVLIAQAAKRIREILAKDRERQLEKLQENKRPLLH
jgi:hypothetical protein